MNRYWSLKANSIVPYTAGEQPKIKNIIKLNTNENAFPPSPLVLRAIAEEAGAGLRKYPAPGADVLAAAAAQDAGLLPENIFCANGSDEALAISFMAFFDPGKPIFTPDITYSFYTVWADLFNLTINKVPLRDDFTVRCDEMAGAPGGVVLANPNAPTGIALSAAEVEKIIASNSCVVIVDEAYVAFGAESVISLVSKYENLVVIRTLSKSHALAGLRVGYAAANKNLIGALQTVRDSFNSYPVDSLAQAGGAAALLDREYYEKTTRVIVETREFTAEALRDMGVLVLPSSSNFLFIRPQVPAETVSSQLREKGIIVRWFNKEKISGFLRVSIGTMEEMKCFIREMECILTSS